MSLGVTLCDIAKLLNKTISKTFLPHFFPIPEINRILATL